MFNIRGKVVIVGTLFILLGSVYAKAEQDTIEDSLVKIKKFSEYAVDYLITKYEDPGYVKSITYNEDTGKYNINTKACKAFFNTSNKSSYTLTSIKCDTPEKTKGILKSEVETLRAEVMKMATESKSKTMVSTALECGKIYTVDPVGQTDICGSDNIRVSGINAQVRTKFESDLAKYNSLNATYIKSLNQKKPVKKACKTDLVPVLDIVDRVCEVNYYNKDTLKDKIDELRTTMETQGKVNINGDCTKLNLSYISSEECPKSLAVYNGYSETDAYSVIYPRHENLVIAYVSKFANTSTLIDTAECRLSTYPIAQGDICMLSATTDPDLAYLETLRAKVLATAKPLSGIPDSSDMRVYNVSQCSPIYHIDDIGHNDSCGGDNISISNGNEGGVKNFLDLLAEYNNVNAAKGISEIRTCANKESPIVEAVDGVCSVNYYTKEKLQTKIKTLRKDMANLTKGVNILEDQECNLIFIAKMNSELPVSISAAKSFYSLDDTESGEYEVNIQKINGTGSQAKEMNKMLAEHNSLVRSYNEAFEPNVTINYTPLNERAIASGGVCTVK